MNYITNSKFNLNDINDNLKIELNSLALPNDRWVKRARKLRSRRWRIVNRKTMNDVFIRK